MSGVALGALVSPFVALTPFAGAAQSMKLARIGFVMTGGLESPEMRVLVEAFRDGLRERGYVEGQNISVEYRSAEGRLENYADVVKAIVALQPAVIVVPNTPSARAAQRLTTTIPTVVPAMGDPVGDGLVESLAHPGRNLTGLTFLGPALVRKRLELLKEARPGASRVAGLWYPEGFGERVTREMLAEADGAARTLGIQLRLVEVHRAADLEGAFATILKERVDALVVFPGFLLYFERRRLMDLVTKHRLFSVAAAREFVDVGGVIAYGANIGDLFRRAAAYVDKILKGARPGDLPVEQPTKFELAVNLKTARALGITIPQSILVRADEVIE